MRIREIRKQKGITQQQLAEKIGVSLSVISRYESGTITPPSERLAKLAEVLGVSVEELNQSSGQPREDEVDAKRIKIDSWQKMQHYARQYILARSQGRCELCGRSLRNEDNGLEVQIHFIQRLSDGGQPIPENMAALCPICNVTVGRDAQGAFTEKLLAVARTVPDFTDEGE